MPRYKFKVLQPDGSVAEDEGIYETPEQLFNELKAQGALLLQYSIKRELSIPFFTGRVSRREIAELLHQLAVSLKSGIPLITILEDLEPELKNKHLKESVKTIKNALRRGATVREAFERAKIFSPIVLSLVEIGEESGRLDRTLEEASQHLYRIDEIISQTKRALTYPSFVLLAMSFALAFWIFYVLPQILKVFQEMNLALPLPTIILMNTVNFFINFKSWILLGIISSIAIFIFLKKNPKTQAPLERILLKLPILGRIKRTSFLAFFFEHFALLLSSGIDMRRLLQLLKRAFANRYYQEIVKGLEDSVTAGEEISSALKKQNIFKPIDIRMVSVGERTGRLDSQMQMIASFYYQEVQNLLEQLTKIIEPVILVLAGLIFLLIVLALIGPIYDLISKVGQF